MVSGPFAEVSKPGLVQSSRRTRAIASLKLGSGLAYQAAAAGHHWLFGVELMRPECHEREQAEQSWRCACDGWIGPLALTFDAQVAPNFGKTSPQ